MTSIASLDRIHREASERIRGGSHDAFLIGFVMSSTMLELSNLLAADLGVYAQACTEILTQLAPIDRCSLRITAVDLPSVVAGVGAEIPGTRGTVGVDIGEFTSGDDVSGLVLAVDVPAQLSSAGFIGLVATQIGSGLGRILEAERLRRRAAIANILALISRLDEEWGALELAKLTADLALLPGAVGASTSAAARRFAGVLTATSGRTGQVQTRYEHDIDDQLTLTVSIQHDAAPSAAHRAGSDRIIVSLLATLARIERNIRLAAEAVTDELTGIGNRRTVSKALIAAKAAADRNDHPLAVLLLDLDHFKEINDRFGHEVGDQILVAVARMLERNVRAYDTVTRWGGEEFLLICPNCGAAEAARIAEKILAECAVACSCLLPSDVVQTASVGFAVYPDVSRTPEALIGAADIAMYTAKRQGRNRYHRAS
jgi:diguanylate cyclase (GGDEF)-like protein